MNTSTKIFRTGVLAATLVLTAVACDNKPSQSSSVVAADPRATALLKDVSGVWSSSDLGIVTIAYNEPTKSLQFLLGDTPTVMRLGDVDADSETVNLTGTHPDTGKTVVWTIRKVWNDSHTAFNLSLITHDGSKTDLSFIRKIGVDDKNRIANIYLAEEQAKKVQTAPVSAPVADAVTAPTPLVAAVAASTPASVAPLLPAQTTLTKPEPASEAEQCRDKKMAVYRVRYDMQFAVQGEFSDRPSDEQVAKQMALARAGASKSCEAEIAAFIKSQPSFDCKKAGNFAEHAACSTPAIAQADVALENAFAAARFFTKDATALDASQRDWLQAKDRCVDEECVRATYQKRIEELNEL